jgi:hypothetical protein
MSWLSFTAAIVIIIIATKKEKFLTTETNFVEKKLLMKKQNKIWSMQYLQIVGQLLRIYFTTRNLIPLTHQLDLFREC